MQRQVTFRKRSEEEEIKDAGLTLDFDEIAKKNSMSKEEGLIAKWYGIYGSRQTGDYMMRVVLPGGVFTADQARACASISRHYAHNVVSVTTRQALQYHRLTLTSLPIVLREVRTANLSSFHGCGDVTRTMTACPLAEDCPHKSFDVRPYAREAMKLLTNSRDLDNLPRKFKVVWSGCDISCAQPGMNCVGMVATSKTVNGKIVPGFKVFIGGGMGWKAFVASSLFTFVPAEKAIAVVRAIALLFRDTGDRYSRAHSRLKFVVDRLGIDVCREGVLKNLTLEHVDTGEINFDPAQAPLTSIDIRPLVDSHTQTLNETILKVLIPKGELTSEQLGGLADIADRYADHTLYTTNRQNLEVHGILPGNVTQARNAVSSLGLATDGAYGLTDMVACVGTTYCPKAVASTRTFFDLLGPVVHDAAYASVRDYAIINITGCPNSCSPYRIADIGFRGARIRLENGSVEGYLITLGGTQWSFGRELGTYTVADCISITRILLDLFVSQRLPKETLVATVARCGLDPFKAAIKHVGTYAQAQALSEYPQPVVPSLLDAVKKKSIARDIPCQEGCPAKTDIPGYIEKIMQGDFVSAHAINLECNVFPGVLGRVCTRPCENKCRHQWTNILGPVSICHLKRSAADRAPKPPLYKPFRAATGKSIGIIGAGPAGLASARELFRLGHSVTLYEREEVAGGMMWYGIPDFRLPREIVARETDFIIRHGIKLLTKENITQTRLLELKKEHDSIIVATGTAIPVELDFKGISADIVINGLAFMRGYNTQEITSLQGDVVIIGGGFTAVDCARSCARAARRIMGEKGHITIVYRRGEAHMSATSEEFEEMTKENINIHSFAAPVAPLITNGKLTGVEFRRSVLTSGPLGTKGKLQEIAGSEFVIKADYCIVAIGQTQEPILPPECVATASFRTSDPKIFVTGDFMYGSGNVIRAVAQGKVCAYRVDESLMGTMAMHAVVSVEAMPDSNTGRVRDHDVLGQQSMAVSPLEIRAELPTTEVDLGFTDKESVDNASRCYFCHYSFEIDQDLCIHCNWCIDAAPRKCISRVSAVSKDADGYIVSAHEALTDEAGTYIKINSDQCIRCGKCLRVCPTNAITMKKVSLSTMFSGAGRS